MKMKHNVSRLLSLLLVMAALAGLLSVSALAADVLESNGTALALSIGDLQYDEKTGKATAGVYVGDGSLSAEDGIVSVTVALDVPAGLQLWEIEMESIGNALGEGSDEEGNEKIILVYNKTRKDDDGSKVQLGWAGGKLATLTFKVKSGAYGEQKIGIKLSGSLVSDTKDKAFVLSGVPATLTLPSATLSFDMNGHGEQVADRTVAVGGTVTEPTAPTATGYTFGGWYTDEDCNTEFDFSTPLNDSTTVYAKWTAKTYTVTFDTDGGSLPEGVASTKTVTYYQPYGELPTPTKNGYKFTGWVLEGTMIPLGSENKVDQDKDHTLMATWADKYDITIDSTPETFTVGDENIGYTVIATVVGSDVAAPTDYTVSYFVDGEWQSAAPTKPGSYAVKITREADDDFNAVAKTIDPALVITKKAVEQPTQGTDPLTYNREKQTFSYTDGNSSAYTVTGDTSATNAGTYKLTFTLNDKANTMWANTKNSEDIVFEYVIEKASISEPDENPPEFVYTGESYHYDLPVDSHDYTVSGNEQTDAGIYYATLSLVEPNNYQWKKAGHSDDLKYRFEIKKAKVDKPTQGAAALTYNGAEQSFELNADANAPYGFDGPIKGKNVGEYTRTVQLKNSNYQWADGTTEDLTFTYKIEPMKITVPTASNQTYTFNGSEQTYEFATAGDSSYYTVKNNTRTDAGSQTVTVILTDKINTVWADNGTTADKIFTFVIAKADKTAPTGLTAEAESIKGKADGEISGLNDTMEYSTDSETWTAIGGKKLENLAAGTYYVRYAENENYKASEAAAVTVGKGAPIVVKFVTGDAEVTVADQELGYEENVTAPEATRTGYKLDGWYKEDNFKNLWNFAEDTVTKDITLYAKWSYSVAVSGDNSFTIGSEPEKGLTIEIGKGLTLSGSFLGNVKVDNKTLDKADYTISEEDGLTVTLSKQFLATLKAGKHTVTIALDDKNSDEDLSVDFTVNEKAAESGTAGSGSAKKDDTKKAPHTGDESDLLLWSVITLGAGAGLVCIGKKRREN